ncbi:MAG: HipA domain-containing protein [Phycisphaeraceae bacterium]|nr:HipA domain-containing protein [Phycisphaeraceae bacterium]
MPIDYDAKTLRSMFGKPIRPTIAVSSTEIALEAQKLAGKLSISGVQPKLSMRLEGEQLVPVAREGQFILKPQTQDFAELPQNEYLCMSMGQRFGLRTAQCLLLELSDGTPAYLVKRFDRFKKGRRVQKLACEDMHQLLGGPDKYAGSHEQIAAAIRDHCTFAPLELQRLFESTIFNFAIGNGDAHRKNFSLLTSEDGTIALSPTYDLVSSRLAIPAESDELALTVNGKRNRLRRADFLAFADHCGIAPEYAERKLTDLLALHETFNDMIAASQLSNDLRDGLANIIAIRLDRLR